MSALESTIAHGNRGHYGNARGNRITCADGFSLSVIAGGGTYCSPRPTLCSCAYGGEPLTPFDDDVACSYPGPYRTVEVGFPSERPEPWVDWVDHCEDPETPTSTVYGQVPVDVVRALVASHGGES